MMDSCQRCFGSRWVCEAHSHMARGKAIMPAAAAHLECRARSATLAMELIRRRCRRALSKTRAHEKAPEDSGALQLDPPIRSVLRDDRATPAVVNSNTTDVLG
jgi:hypothetical protein